MRELGKSAVLAILVALGAVFAILWLRAPELPLVREGQALPDLSLTRIGGFGELRFSDFKGRPMLILALDTECCAQVAAAGERLAREFARRGLAVLVVAADADRAKLDAGVRKLGLMIPVVEDPGRKKFGEKFGSGGLPQVYLVDREGTVRFAYVGDLDLENEAMRARISSVLLSTGANW